MISLEKTLTSEGFLEPGYNAVSKDSSGYDSKKDISYSKYNKVFEQSLEIARKYTLLEPPRYDVSKRKVPHKKGFLKNVSGKVKAFLLSTDDAFFSKQKTTHAYNQVEKIETDATELLSCIKQMRSFYSSLDKLYLSNSNARSRISEEREKNSSEARRLNALKKEIYVTIRDLVAYKDSSRETPFNPQILMDEEIYKISDATHEIEKLSLAGRRINRKLVELKSLDSDFEVKINSSKEKISLLTNLMESTDREINDAELLRKTLLKAQEGYENYILSRKSIWG